MRAYARLPLNRRRPRRELRLRLLCAAVLAGVIVAGAGTRRDRLLAQTPSTARPAARGKASRPDFRASLGHTKVYGLPGEGFKFVYCFDHSASMGGAGNNALKAAKAELLASLEHLEPTHQFQIIFYNARPTIFAISGQPGRLVFATDQNKGEARRFIEGIKPSGGTDHQAALEMALNLAPDVVFFLTDANEPAMTASQLARIARRNGGAVINAIEFGQGASPGSENFLTRLARENAGGYTYVDLTKTGNPGER